MKKENKIVSVTTHTFTAESISDYVSISDDDEPNIIPKGRIEPTAQNQPLTPTTQTSVPITFSPTRGAQCIDKEKLIS